MPVAVGSGVINDLVKYAAELAGTPYVCVPTAASMDGYAASGAALREGGFKRTLACAAPVAIVADLDVIATAPAVMGAWGYGDLVGKLVAGVDWIVADALGEEPLESRARSPWCRTISPPGCANPAGVRERDRAALDGLMRGLLMSGLAMQAHGNSRPASGSDHQFAHLWEMEELALDGQPVSHGACVGIGCVSMLAAYEWLLHQDMRAIDPARLAARAPSTAALKAEIADVLSAVLHGGQCRDRDAGQGVAGASASSGACAPCKDNWREPPADAARAAAAGRDGAAVARHGRRAVHRGGARYRAREACARPRAGAADPPAIHRPRRAARSRLARPRGRASCSRRAASGSTTGGRHDMMMRRSAVAGLLAAAVSAAPALAQQKVEVQFWHAMSGVLGERVDEIVKRFNASQDKYTVVATNKGNYDEVINAHHRRLSRQEGAADRADLRARLHDHAAVGRDRAGAGPADREEEGRRLSATSSSRSRATTSTRAS